MTEVRTLPSAGFKPHLPSDARELNRKHERNTMQQLHKPVTESVTANNHVDAASHLHRKYKGCSVKLQSQYDFSGLGVITYTFLVWKVKVASDASQPIFKGGYPA